MSDSELKHIQPIEQHIQGLAEALDSGMFVHVRKILNTLPAADVAHIFESSPPATRQVLWKLINEEHQGDVLLYMVEDVRTSFMEQMAPEALANATEGLEIDDVTDLLRDLPEQVYEQVLSLLDHQDKLRIQKAMAYPEDSAGGLMNTDTITVREHVSLDVVLRYLRTKESLPNTTDALYVVDQDDKLIGQLALTTLVTSAAEMQVGELMDTDIIRMRVDITSTEVANLFERHDIVSAPVVDDEHRLLGRITIDDVVDVIRDEAEHSLMGMAGMDEDEDTFAPVLMSTKSRAIWLGLNLVTAFTAAFVSNLFEDTLEKLVSLAILMTIVPSMGGVAGSQTLTLVIRGLALGHIGKNNTRWLVGKELAVGFLNGLLWAAVVAIIATVWKGDWKVGLIIAAAMTANLIVAALSGVGIPLLMKKVGIDPALAGAVVLTTITDVVGLLAFLGLATVFL